MSSQSTTDFRRRRKLNLIKVCGERCNICGYNKSVTALEFHHIYPEEKEYGIGATGTCHDIEKDLNEVQKCILVCSNCHREIHDGFYSIEELLLKKQFNNEIAEQLIIERNSKFQTKPEFCSQCGKKISRYSSSGLCVTCAQEKTRIVTRPNREELKQLIQDYSFTELGRKFNVADNTVRKWCKSVNLPSRKKDIDLIQNWDEI